MSPGAQTTFLVQLRLLSKLLGGFTSDDFRRFVRAAQRQPQEAEQRRTPTPLPSKVAGGMLHAFLRAGLVEWNGERFFARSATLPLPPPVEKPLLRERQAAPASMPVAPVPPRGQMGFAFRGTP